MKKNKVKDTTIPCTDKRVVIACIVSAIVLLCSYLLAYFGIVPPLSMRTLRIIYICIIAAAIFISFISFLGTLSILLVGIIGDYILMKQDIKKSKEVKHYLSNVPKPIRILDKSNLMKFITEDNIHCEANLDENGNIHYLIKIDVENTTDDYSKFLNNFDIT